MVDVATVLADFEAESEVLDALVARLPDSGWAQATASPGWSIAHQIGHLAWTDAVVIDAAAAANGDTDAFAALRIALQSGAITIDGAAAELAALPPAQLLVQWREGRRRMAASLREVAEGARLPWFGPPMSPTSMATARIMETWAHGQDIADALGATREPTNRLRHIAHLAVRTRNFAFKANKLTPPEEEFRVELSGAAGENWAWGPEDAAEKVSGSAEDFCLLATRRRHRDDLALSASGPNADKWLDIVQAFAGPPGEGRKPVAAGEIGTPA
ncbi:TIGR03084 family metal-binding protein [Arthrobacter alpinus]|uniref:TIGR03084 family metal-binding protein n=1 Tax=Arthrobacter alpinus TaxID=656366 RepID=UPI001647C034|nr:TIGR03084 family metal-binding protein [Arthrobacter alpinus]